ncbi:16S rRNA (cytosine(967)-C(5))-methyltransferase RsmB [Testudinibacter sp. P80/BLE/0925]|uniref:16S rRNA (cytosine(967)-C(5))-methyltransferase RsmB n=1 Tax=Testudinibacter sp. TW-1 TaxID=3417757 RepID=UPI003D36CC64
MNKIKTSQSLSARAAAAQILLQVLDQGKSLSALLPEAANHVKAQDLPLLQAICFGVCRTLPRLERIIGLLVQKPLKGKTRIVHCLLLVGLYQLLYLRIPSHAAVDEVVNAGKSLKADGFRSLLNGVLRRFLREQDAILAVVDKHWQTLHPEWLVNRLKQDYPEQWREIVEANNQQPPMWLRVNQRHCSSQDYVRLLNAQGIAAESGTPDCAIRLQSAVGVKQLPHFEQGWVTVQDSHAQWAALLLDPQNGETVLDACAAPGGKTTHILERAPQAKVMALDIEAGRLQRVKDNLRRLNQQAEIVCGDASQPQQWLADGVQFDRILLDAPCSATGVIRRHPDIKWLRQAQDIDGLSQLQQQILTALWARLKVGGTLVYATCSVLKQENQQQIEAFLAQHRNAKLEVIFGQPEASGRQFLPQADGGDGFYYAKLSKTA